MASSPHDYTFNSLLFYWTVDASCNPNLTGLAVVYSLKDGSGYVGNLLVEETPNLVVTNVTFQKSSAMSIKSGNLAGYQFSIGSSAPAVLTNSYAEWHVPSVTAPNGWACWWNAYCELFGPWVGLASSDQGYIAQGGTYSSVQCAIFSCTSFYGAWYEFLDPNNTLPVFCDASWRPNQNDWITASVMSGADYGGNPNYYSIIVYDQTKQKACSGYKTNYGMGKANYAMDMIETRVVSNALPAFSTINFYGQMDYLDQWNTIHLAVINVPYNNGWYTRYDIWTSDDLYQCTNTSNVTSSGTFTITYLRSTDC